MTLPERPPKVSIHKAHGVNYRMYTSPGKIGRAFRAGTPYELPMLEWIFEWSDTQPEGEVVVVDAGANIGNHSLWMSKVCGLSVHAFEPVIPDILNANVDLNGAEVTVWPWALGAKQGRGYHVSKGEIRAGVSKESTDEAFDVVRLDDVVMEADIRSIKLIKVDIEGMEVEMLQGGLYTIERDRPVILTEEWESETTRRIGKMISRFGYKRVHHFGGRGRAPVGVWEAK